MKKYGIKVAACAIAGTLSLTGYQSSLEAKRSEEHTSELQ